MLTEIIRITRATTLTFHKMKTKITTQRKAPSQVADITIPKLSDSDWRDNAKVLNAFPVMRDHWHCPRYGVQTFEDNLGNINEGAMKLIEKINEEPAFKAEIDAHLFIEDGLFYMLTKEQYDESVNAVETSNVLNVSRLRGAAHACNEAIKIYFEIRTEQQLKTLTELLESEHDEEYSLTPNRDELLREANGLKDWADSLADEHRQVLEQKLNGNPYAEVA